MRSKLLIPNTTQVPNVVLDKVMPLLPEAPLKVLMVIVRLTYGFQKHSDRVGFGQLAQRTGMGRREVIRAVKILGNILNVRKGGPRKGANEYSLNLDISDARLAVLRQRIKTRGSDHSDTKVVTQMTPSQTKTKKTNKSAESASPIPESISSLSNKRKTTRAAPDPAQLEAFNQFYQAYPRHVAKEAAWVAWQKLNPDPALVLAIHSGVKRYAAEVRDTEPRFIKHPGPWLNGKRWQDEANSTGNGQAPAVVKDIGNSMVEVDGLKMMRTDYEKKYDRAN